MDTIARDSDPDIDYEVEDEAQFWQEIDEIIHPPSTTMEAVCSAVNNFIAFVSQFGADYLSQDTDVEICCEKFLESDLFMNQASQVRTALIDYQPEPEKVAKCYVNLYILLLDGRQNSRTFKLMRRANMVPTIARIAKDNQTTASRFTRLALTILYEMFRMQKMSAEDLKSFNEEYIWFLLRTVEVSNDDEDPYSYRAIKVVVSLNEQFMVASLPESLLPFSRSSSTTALMQEEEPRSVPQQAQNNTVKVLSAHGARFKTFGENLIRMLNRERDTALQLLILKQLFLLFTNPDTYEYFYTNDLHVLVDVFIRDLYNLPSEEEALRHTYLRVLHPLLTHTQLRNPPFYKGPELISLLNSLNQECSHFGPVGTTTVRLLARCLTVPWLLPPRRKKLKLPCPTFPERKKSSKSGPVVMTLGMSLDKSEQTSQVSLTSTDSVTSIAKVRPPTTPRVRPAVKVRNGSRIEGLSTVKEGAAVQQQQPRNKTKAVVDGEKRIDGIELAVEKHEHLLKEMSKLEVTA